MASPLVRNTRGALVLLQRAALAGLLAVVTVAFAATGLAAQNGQITGVVTNAGSSAPLSEVQVYLVGQDYGALSRSDGRYLIVNVAPGTYTLRAERIGFQGSEQSVTVTAGGTATTNFALATQALGLDDIVVTGTAGASTRREIGNTISQINAVDVPDAPVRVSDMLQAAAPGLDVYGGGAVGQAKIIRLRGSNSAMLNEHPIIYVDGVRIRSNPLPDANPPDRRGGRSGNVAVSPLDQINPNDIDRIEVIKGSAATTLYGTEASGGVIQIFTKRGSGGAAVWTAEVQTGTEWSRAFGVSPSGIGDAGIRTLTEEARYNFMDPFMCTGFLTCGEYKDQSYNLDYSLSARGGAGGVNYFVSGAYGDAAGYLANDAAERYSARSNLSFSPLSGLQIQWNTSYALAMMTQTAQQNNAEAIVLNAYRQERNYFVTGDADVLSVLLDQDIKEDVERFNTGTTITYSPIADLTSRFVVGYDWTQREHRNLRPFGWPQTPLGKLLNNTFQNRVLSLDFVSTYDFDIAGDVSSSFSAGAQAIGDDAREVEGYGENFPGAALPTLNSAALTQSYEERTKIWNAGFFLQNVLDISNKYYITAGVRVDGNSSFGEDFGFQVYPKVSGSWVLSDESFYPEWGEMKVRAAYGQSGRAPGPFDKVRTWQPEGLGGQPAFVPQNLGNRDLGPEVTTEVEGGFDASWLDGRLSTSFSYYRQITDDLLLNVPQLPSGGFSTSQLTNVGKLANRGVEVQVDATVYESNDWAVDVGLGYSTNNSEILELDETVVTNSRRVGYPIIAVVDERIANPDAPANVNGDVQFVQPGDPDFNGTGETAAAYLWGSNLPTVFLSPSFTIRAPMGITIAARGDYKGGFYMNQEVFAIGRSVRSPLCYPYYQDPANSTTLNADIPALWYARCNRADVEGYVWDASYFKLRSLSASIPMDFLMPSRFSSSTLTIALNNGWLWMKEMPFMDPETQTDPDVTGPQQGYEFEETVPPPKSLRIALRITF